MIVADVMDELGDLLETLTDLRVYRWPSEDIQPPAAIVPYPSDYTFDDTYRRGMDRMTAGVTVLVGRAYDRTARDKVGAYVDGPGSIKAVVEPGAHRTFDTVRVTGVDFDIYQKANVKYLAAIFSLDITGKGS